MAPIAHLQCASPPRHAVAMLTDDEVAAAIRRRGGICHVSVLERDGIPAVRVQRAAAAGGIRRVRPGWYSVGQIAPELLAAVRSGGALSCVSALRLRGAWAIDDGQLHVRTRRGTRLPASTRVRRHWTDEPVSSPIDDAARAARCAVRCLPEDHAIAVLDSALHLRLITFADLRGETSARARRVIEQLDARSESGLESLARVRLRRLQIQLRPQVRIPGVGRVDLLIGDRLILELDGEEWHDFEEDRARDRRAAVRGFLSLRASYDQVLLGWEEVEAHVLALIRRGAHRWRGHAADSHAAGQAATPGRRRRRLV